MMCCRNFTDEAGRSALKILFRWLAGVYAAGRLDRDSEGLLVLTNDGALQAKRPSRVSAPARSMFRWKANPRPSAALRDGVTLNGGPTLPARRGAVEDPSGCGRATRRFVSAVVPTHAG